jgi:excisionase family DNA binding protein
MVDKQPQPDSRIDDGVIPPQPDRPLDDDMLLTFTEAAAYLRATTRQVKRWVHNGSLPAVPMPTSRGKRVAGLTIRHVREGVLSVARPSTRSAPRPKVKVRNRSRRAS